MPVPPEVSTGHCRFIKRSFIFHILAFVDGFWCAYLPALRRPVPMTLLTNSISDFVSPIFLESKVNLEMSVSHSTSSSKIIIIAISSLSSDTSKICPVVRGQLNYVNFAAKIEIEKIIKSHGWAWSMQAFNHPQTAQLLYLGKQSEESMMSHDPHYSNGS